MCNEDGECYFKMSFVILRVQETKNFNYESKRKRLLRRPKYERDKNKLSHKICCCLPGS